MRKPKTQKLVNVKGSVVHGSSKTYLRDQHTRKMEVSLDDPPSSKEYISDKITGHLQTGEVVSKTELFGADRGVTMGVHFLKIAPENPNDPPTTAYFKSVKDDPFVGSSGRLMRRTVKLYNKATGKAITDPDEYIDIKKLPDGGRETHRGYMLDRELATFALSKELGMDHLPDASARRVNINGENKLGLVVRDIMDQFKEPGYNITKSHLTSQKFKSRGNQYETLAQYDKKLGDKLAFDLLIGNTDRHTGNIMIKENGETAEMLAFDQGLSFPDNNSQYVISNFRNQIGIYQGAKSLNLTPTFVKKFAEFITGDNFEKFTEYVSNNIGPNEAEAFVDRAAFFADQIFNKKAKNIQTTQFVNNSW